MNSHTRLTLSQVSAHFRIDFEIVRDFAEFGLYPTVFADGEVGIDAENLESLKKIIVLHEALGVNKEGIEIILKLEDRVASLQNELEQVRHDVEKLNRQRGIDDTEVLRGLGLLVEIVT